MFFLIFLLNFGIQTLPVGDSEFFVFHHKNDFIILKGDSLYRSIDGLNWDSYKVKNTPIGFDYSYIKNNDITYIIKSGLGIVYKFNSLKNDFERLNNSFD